MKFSLKKSLILATIFVTFANLVAKDVKVKKGDVVQCEEQIVFLDSSVIQQLNTAYTELQAALTALTTYRDNQPGGSQSLAPALTSAISNLQQQVANVGTQITTITNKIHSALDVCSFK